MTSAGSRIEKMAKNKLLISAVIAVGIIAALFYSVPAYAFAVGGGQAGVNWVNGTRDITLTVPITKATDEAIVNVSAKLMVNGSTAGSTIGKDYVYATNCTPGFYYDSSSGYGTSGYGTSGYGYDNGTLGLGYGYNIDTGFGYGYVYGFGYGYGYYGQMSSNASAPFYCTFNFNNLDYNTAYAGAYVLVNGYQLEQAVSFSDAIYIYDYPTLFTSIKTALALNNVTTNIDTCGATANACTGLYFNASSPTNISQGANITFTGTLDLTSSTTVTFLQNLEDYMNTTQGMIQLNATNSATFAAAGTQITMYGLPNYGAVLPSLTVTYDNGTITTSPSEVSGLTYNGAAGTLFFAASHLSKYQMNVPYVANSSTITITDTTSQVVLDAGTPAFTVSVPSNAVSAVLNASVYLNANATMSNATINVSIVATSTSSLLTGTVNVSFPANITIYGPANWTGQIDLPIVKATSSATVTPDSGYTATTNAVVEVGFGDEQLNFSKAVRILIPGMAGKSAAYKRGSTVTKITLTCAADTQAAGDALANAAECSITVGSDLAIWTKHFTQFIAYTQTANSNTGTSTSATNYTAIYTTPTPTPVVTATATQAPDATPVVSGTPIDQEGATPVPGQDGAATPTPTITATIQPTSTPITAGDSGFLIIAAVVILGIGAAAFFFMQKK